MVKRHDPCRDGTVAVRQQFNGSLAISLDIFSGSCGFAHKCRHSRENRQQISAAFQAQLDCQPGLVGSQRFGAFAQALSLKGSPFLQTLNGLAGELEIKKLKLFPIPCFGNILRHLIGVEAGVFQHNGVGPIRSNEFELLQKFGTLKIFHTLGFDCDEPVEGLCITGMIKFQKAIQ